MTDIIDTICALATAPGGALGVIRVSGPDAFAAVSAICHIDGRSVAANTVHYTHILNASGEAIDEVMVSIFRAPRSYTGEDSVEISCHGSRYILNKVLELLIQNGCRMAHPGEFTQRAYLNGKMDLSQAEAVADLIASTNKATHQLAMSQLRGGISSELSILRERLLKMTTLLELELDFSDHEDLEFADRTELLELANKIDRHITKLALSFEKGQAIKNGILVAIVGKTNVGKSTLLNCLLKDERAIVSDVHGTTRDTIEDCMDIQGITFRFIDTAGIRQTSDQVEQIGIQRTYQAIDKAHIILWLTDQQPTDEEIKEMLHKTSGKHLIITQNKIDTLAGKHTTEALFCHADHCTFVSISAKHRLNIDRLEQAIYDAADLSMLASSDVIISNARHYEALTRAQAALQRVIENMKQQLSGDLLAEDLRDILNVLSEITGGQITPNEVLGNIFKNFCVGK